MPTTADILLRDFVRYHQDGLPNDPGPSYQAPYGDPRSGVHNPSKRDFRQALNSVSGAADAANAAADRANNAADALMSFAGRYEQMVAAMMKGGSVQIAAYGDSTTDGHSTTGWVLNPVDASGNAIGAAAHTPPNAWPAIMQTVIRQMFANSSISIWNAGYGGKAIVDGWALANFNRAILANPAYGLPTAVLINFGINDIRRTVYTADLMRSRLIELVTEMDRVGTFPIFVLPDATSSDDDANPATLAGLNDVYRSVAERHGIMVIDTNPRQQAMWEARGDGIARWVSSQPDGIHGNDTWHSLKGALVAAYVFPNTLWADDKPVINIAPWSQYANSKGLTFAKGVGVANVFGASMNVTESTYTLGQALQKIWVWNTSPDRELYWHSVDADGYYSPRPFASGPTIELYDYLSKANIKTPSPTSGWLAQSSGRRAAETPGFIGRLAVGLSRVLFYAPTDAVDKVIYVGYFSLRRPKRISQAHIITHSGAGPLGRDDWADRECPMAVGFGRGRSMHAFYQFSVSDKAGVFLWSGRTFSGGATAEANIRRGVMLFRTSDTSASLYDAFHYGDGTAAVIGGALATATVTVDFWNTGRIRVYADVSGSNQRIFIYAGFTSSSVILSASVASTAEPLAFGGSPCAVFSNLGAAGQTLSTCDLVAVNYI